MRDLTILIPTRLRKENLPKIEFIISQFENTKILLISNKNFNREFKNIKILISKKKNYRIKLCMA